MQQLGARHAPLPRCAQPAAQAAPWSSAWHARPATRRQPPPGSPSGCAPRHAAAAGYPDPRGSRTEPASTHRARPHSPAPASARAGDRRRPASAPAPAHHPPSAHWPCGSTWMVTAPRTLRSSRSLRIASVRQARRSECDPEIRRAKDRDDAIDDHHLCLGGDRGLCGNGHRAGRGIGCGLSPRSPADQQQQERQKQSPETHRGADRPNTVGRAAAMRPVSRITRFTAGEPGAALPARASPPPCTP